MQGHPPDKIALLGVHNTGKSTLYNRLTSRHDKVANLSGLTVDLLHGPRPLNNNSRSNLLVDLLGINDMNGSSKDELVTNKFLRLTSPDMLLVWLGRAHRSVLVCSAQRWVRHQKCFDPVVVPPLADPIGDRGGISRDLKPLAECFGEALKLRARQPPHRGKNLLDGGRIEELQSYLCRGLDSRAVALRSRRVAS